MELYEAIAKRRIVRDFKDEEVPLETIEKIIGAGLMAPTHDHPAQLGICDTARQRGEGARASVHSRRNAAAA